MRLFLPSLSLLFAFTFTACTKVALDERFYNKELLNWTALDDEYTIEGPSDWRVEPDGWLYQRSNIWGRRGDFLGKWEGTYLVAGSQSWDDYSITLKAQPGDDDGFGVVFRVADSKHFYRLLFVQDGLNGGPLARLDKRDGEEYTELWSAQRGYKPGEVIFLEIEAEGDTLRGLVNGNHLFEVKDGSYKKGKIGLFCYAQNWQAFDDVRVVFN